METVFGLKYEKVISIGEHRYYRPAAPKKKEDILFFNETKENAYWKRKTDYPAIWYQFVPYTTLVDCEATLYNADQTELLQLSKKDSDIIRSIYEDEIKKRVNGVFFKNGDELEYLTGSNWFTLQHCKMFGNSKNEGYGLFYKYQRDVFYLLEIIWDPNILGLYLSKAKKTGITQIIDGGYCVDMATRKSEWMIGFMSRNKDVAIENNFKLFLFAFDNLPMALKPKVGAKADKGGNIEFSEIQRKKITKISTGEVLNTKVFCVPTADHSFDSHFMNIIRFDEFPKYWQDSKKEPKEVLRNNKAGAKDQDEFRGRIIISSYPPEIDDVGAKQGGEVFSESELSTTKYGKTISELICYHIPAYKSLKSCIDKYGDCDEKKAMVIIMQERERVVKDKKALLALIRQFPNDKKEAFGTAGSSSVFDTTYLADVEFDLEEELNQSPTPLWVEGNLEWSVPLWNIGKHDKRPCSVFSEVIFIPLTKNEIMEGKTGKIRMYQSIPIQDRNDPLRYGTDPIGNLNKPERFKYFGGMDPTAYADSDDVEESSMQCSYTFNIHDERLNAMNRGISSKIIISEYNHRPALAEEAYQDMVKEIIYFGKIVAVESNQPHLFTRLKNEGLMNYMIVKHNDGYYTPWDIKFEDNEWKRIVRTRNAVQNEVLETIVELIKHYIFYQEGMNEYARTIKSLDLIRQLKTFKVEDTKKFDCVMGLGYSLLAYEAYIASLYKSNDSNLQEGVVRGMLEALAS